MLGLISKEIKEILVVVSILMALAIMGLYTGIYLPAKHAEIQRACFENIRDVTIALCIYEYDYKFLPTDPENYVSLIFPYLHGTDLDSKKEIFHCPQDNSQYQVPYNENGDKLYLSYAFNARMAGEGEETLGPKEYGSIPTIPRLVEAEGVSAVWVDAVINNGEVTLEFGDRFSEEAVKKAASRHQGWIALGMRDSYVEWEEIQTP